MKSGWKKYLLYSILIIIGGSVIFVLSETVRAKNTGFETKTLWDWMELLIIPLVLAVGAFFLQRSERAVERQTTEKRAELEREIAKDRQQEVALQAYIDRMSDLLLDRNLQTTSVKEVRDVARTLTISVMRNLDKDRNDLVVQFLREAQLINDENSILNSADMAGMKLRGLDFRNVYLQKAILENVDLTEANLRGAHLEETILIGAKLGDVNLHGAYLERANLKGAYLKFADFTDARLEDARLVEADLTIAQLEGSNLRSAKLNNANLFGASLDRADLYGADLRGAKMNTAFLSGANLEMVDLAWADLTGAIVNDEQLERLKLVSSIIMPDGTKNDLNLINQTKMKSK